MDIRETNNDDESNATTKPVFGSFTNQIDCTLDLRKSFVIYNQIYMLHFWHALDRDDLMKMSMQHLDYSILAQNGEAGVPNVINVWSDNEMFCATKK